MRTRAAPSIAALLAALLVLTLAGLLFAAPVIAAPVAINASGVRILNGQSQATVCAGTWDAGGTAWGTIAGTGACDRNLTFYFDMAGVNTLGNYRVKLYLGAGAHSSSGGYNGWTSKTGTTGPDMAGQPIGIGYGDATNSSSGHYPAGPYYSDGFLASPNFFDYNGTHAINMRYLVVTLAANGTSSNIRATGNSANSTAMAVLEFDNGSAIYNPPYLLASFWLPDWATYPNEVWGLWQFNNCANGTVPVTYTCFDQLLDAHGTVIANGTPTTFTCQFGQSYNEGAFNGGLFTRFTNVPNGSYRMGAVCNVNGNPAYGSASDVATVSAIVGSPSIILANSTAEATGQAVNWWYATLNNHMPAVMVAIVALFVLIGFGIVAAKLGSQIVFQIGAIVAAVVFVIGMLMTEPTAALILIVIVVLAGVGLFFGANRGG